jgi:hypothetical protein
MRNRSCHGFQLLRLPPGEAPPGGGFRRGARPSMQSGPGKDPWAYGCETREAFALARRTGNAELRPGDVLLDDPWPLGRCIAVWMSRCIAGLSGRSRIPGQCGEGPAGGERQSPARHNAEALSPGCRFEVPIHCTTPSGAVPRTLVEGCTREQIGRFGESTGGGIHKKNGNLLRCPGSRDWSRRACWFTEGLISIMTTGDPEYQPSSTPWMSSSLKRDERNVRWSRCVSQ